jgi:hypothetical protein
MLGSSPRRSLYSAPIWLSDFDSSGSAQIKRSIRLLAAEQSKLAAKLAQPPVATSSPDIAPARMMEHEVESGTVYCPKNTPQDQGSAPARVKKPS